MKKHHLAALGPWIFKYGHPILAIPVLFASYALGTLLGNHSITMFVMIPVGACFVIWMTLAVYNIIYLALRFSFDSTHRQRTLAKIRELRPKS